MCLCNTNVCEVKSKFQVHSVYSATFQVVCTPSTKGAWSFVLCVMRCVRWIYPLFGVPESAPGSLKGAILISYIVFWFLRLKGSSAYCLICNFRTCIYPFIRNSLVTTVLVWLESAPNQANEGSFKSWWTVLCDEYHCAALFSSVILCILSEI